MREKRIQAILLENSFRLIREKDSVPIECDSDLLGQRVDLLFLVINFICGDACINSALDVVTGAVFSVQV